MSTTTIVFSILAVAALLGGVLYLWGRQMRRQAGRIPTPAVGATRERVPDAVNMPPLTILLAVDGSPGSDAATESLVNRPLPAGTTVEAFTVVHTNVPFVPDVFLGGAAAHVAALEEARSQAPERVRAARERLAGITGIALLDRTEEGDPAPRILAEATRLGANLIVMGAHGRARASRTGLGSVPRTVVKEAACSVEVVRPCAVTTHARRVGDPIA